MAIIKKQETSEEKPEMMEGGFVPETPEPAQETVQEPVQAQENVPATVTPATAPVVVEGAAPSILELKNALEPGFFGRDIVKLAGKNGALSGKIGNETFTVGSWADIQVMSYNERYLVAPIVPEINDEAKKFCRYSYDGKTIEDQDNGTMTVEEYEASIAKDYPKGCKVSPYYDLIGMVIDCEKNLERAIDLTVLMFQISQTAMGPFNFFASSVGMKVKRGLVPATHQNCLRVEAKATENKKGSFTVLSFTSCPRETLAAYTPV